MTAGSNLATHGARVLHNPIRPKRKRAWGMPGAQRTRSRAWCVVSTRVSHHGCAGSPGIPARDGFNGLFRALPGDRALLSPSLADLLSANLTPASRRQDHTTSPSASAPFVHANVCALVLPRPSHPLPYVRDDRETPLCVGRDDQRCRSDLGQKGMGIFLRMGLDTDLLFCPSGAPHSSFPGASQRVRPLAGPMTGSASEPGIHNHRRNYGFRACAKWRIPE